MQILYFEMVAKRVKLFVKELTYIHEWQLLWVYVEKLIKTYINKMSRVVGKPAFCICENKDADQLLGNREADQRLCFRYTDRKIPQLPTSKISSL